MQVGQFCETYNSISVVIKAILLDLSSDKLLKTCLNRQVKKKKKIMKEILVELLRNGVQWTTLLVERPQK